MKSYLKFLSRNKLYTAVEAAGLVISVSFIILIGNYVWQQYKAAYEHPFSDRIYAVGNGRFLGLTWWDKAEIEEKIPEVETACRLNYMGEAAYSATETGEKIVSGLMKIDPSFFQMFPHYRLEDGSLEEFDLAGNKCLVSRSLARTLYGDDALGKDLWIQYRQSLVRMTVCGVFSDFGRTLMKDTGVLLNARFDQQGKMAPFSVMGDFTTIFQVREGTDRTELAGKVHDVLRPHYRESRVPSFPLYSLPEVYFNNSQWTFRSSNRTVLQLLSVVVLLLLVSAVFNYINLSLALSGRRVREMAMRRLLGSSKPALFGKLIGESLAFTAVCFMLALMAAWILVPMMDRLLEGVTSDVQNGMGYLPLQLSWSPGTLSVYGLAVILIGTMAGVVPAAVASRCEPMDVVRGTFRRHTKMLFSKIFITIQNAFSIILIAMALIMEGQTHHLLNRPLHARTEGLYMMRIVFNEYEQVEPLIGRLEQLPGVGRIGYGTSWPGLIFQSFGLSKNPEESLSTNFIIGDENYFDLMELDILDRQPVPPSNTVWISQSLANELMPEDPSMMKFISGLALNGTSADHFGGVYADIPGDKATNNEQNPYSMVFVADRNNIHYALTLMVEVTGRRAETAAAIRQAYADWSVEKYGMVMPLPMDDYADRIMQDQLLPERTAMRLVELFMALSVLISLLGLLAMSTYYSGENTKSIAVRKVFGSDVQRELRRMIADYIRLVLLAAVIGVPIAVWLSGRYLERYDYRISGYGWVFAVAVLLSVAFAFISVFWQTLRVAQAHPAVELKKD